MATPTLVEVTGTLVDPSGAAIENAIIAMTTVDSPQQVQQGTNYFTLGLESLEEVSTSTGTFSISVIAGGKFRLTINAVGYDQVVVIPDDGTTTIDFIGLSEAT